MHSDHPLTAGERHFLVAFLGALPAIYLGFQIGSLAADIGSHRDLTSIFVRALVCATPAALLAFVAPRVWLLPSLIYGYGFYCGYILGDVIDAASRFFVAIFVAIPIAALTGQRIGTRSEPAHPELFWLFVVALWLATAFVAAPDFLYYLNGWYQFGMRHALDFMPFLFVLMALAVRAKMPAWGMILCVYSAIAGAWGVWWWNVYMRTGT